MKGVPNLMKQSGNMVEIKVKGEGDQWVMICFETKHESKQFHNKVYDKNGKIIWNPRRPSGTK